MNNAEINELLLAPTERLSMELKAWLHGLGWKTIGRRSQKR